MRLFDINHWSKAIRREDWYQDVPNLLQSLSDLKNSNRELYEKEKSKMLDFFIDVLSRGKVSLGNSGENQDRQRKVIDTIIVHHTGSKPGMTKDKLSALELIRLYAPVYADNYKKVNNSKPIFSNHFREEKMVFWPYHWIVRKNGTAERLLFDDEIGWQAGNWDVNCRSIAIVLDADYENNSPSEKEIESIANIITNNYPNITSKNILGHCEVNPKTVCPSNNFLGENGWKKDLLKIVEEMRR